MIARRTIVVLVAISLLGVGVAVDLTVASIDGDEVPTHEELLFSPTDPFDADTDGDGLTDGRELREFDTDPTSPDTDGDGLNDFDERWRYDTDPTDTNTDGDGLADGPEVETHGTDPETTDTDEDGLADGRELELGTSPTDEDTDGDWLKDSWEVRGRAPNGLELPESDPLHKDLYVETAVLADAESPPEGYADYVVAEFADMSVSNPDGEQGIAVHFERPQRRVPVSVADLHEQTDYDVNYLNVGHFGQVVYEKDYMGERTNVYHLLTFVPADARITEYGAAGVASWKVAVVSDGVFGSQTRTRHVVVHELLHTIAGPVGSPGCTAAPNKPLLGSRHTCEGYLSYTDDTFFSDRTVTWLSQNDYYNEDGNLVNVTDES